MKIIFEYNLEKDKDNFLKSFKSQNNKKPTKLQQLYVEQVGEINEEKVLSFLESQNTEAAKKLEAIKSDWQKIEEPVFVKIEELFGINLDTDITVYLSTNQRCTYNISENYFFVYFNSKSTNSIIVHELLHFYTWHAFHDGLQSKGISKEEYNDIKESLTEIMNIDFIDILDGYIDEGYQQHKEMRQKVRNLRTGGKSIREIVNELSS